MQRFKLAGCASVVLLAIVSASRSEDALDPFALAEDPRIPHLISQLNDPDSLVRNDSIQRLMNLGQAARPALRRAVAGASPQVRAGIDRVLLHIPWAQPGDAPQVEEAFTGYAELEAEDRCARIDGWILPLHVTGAPALLRIILNDPSPAVRWEAAAALRDTIDLESTVAHQVIELSEETTAQERYLPADENAPLLAAAGWAVRLAHPVRADELMKKALRIENNHPSAFRGQMDFVFFWMIDRAELARNHALAVLLYRQQADRTAWSDDRVPDAVTSLFAEQAEYGPFPGFDDDLRCYREYFMHPEMIYTMARLAQRRGNTIQAEALSTTALLMSGSSEEDHTAVAGFLELHDWNAAAERELKFALALTSTASDANTINGVVNIYFRLSELANKRDDDLAAAKYLETGLKKNPDSKNLIQSDRFGRITPLSVDDEWAEVHWHYLRAARTARNQAEINIQLEQLLSLDRDAHVLQHDPGKAADIVPTLQELGRANEAAAIFDAAYQALKAKVDEDPEDPMPRNNLAWLCACSGIHLDEAKKLADQAVEMVPDDAACLDTQAEVYLRLGHAAKAVEIETRALEIKPDDVYMQNQVERFKKAASKT